MKGDVWCLDPLALRTGDLRKKSVCWKKPWGWYENSVTWWDMIFVKQKRFWQI